MAWSGPLAIAALLATAAGMAKWVRPAPAVEALQGVGVRFVTGWLVRVGAAVEVALGAAALAGLPPAMVGLGASYLAFAAFVVVARAHPDVRSCGCLGERDTPPSWRHVALDAGLAAGCLGAAATGVPDLGSVLSKQPLAGVPFSVVVVVGVWLASVVLADRSAALVRAPGSAT